MKKAMGIAEEARFEYKGYPCVVLFMEAGHRCGYVGVPKGKKVNEDIIRCHGSITYARNELALQTDTDRFWIGFDTAHCFDKRDYKKAKEYFGEDVEVMKRILLMEALDDKYGLYGEIRTLEFCIEECKQIIEQIIEMESKR